MRYWLCVISLIATTTYAQTDKLSSKGFEKTIQELKKKDDAENFTYTFVDEYLAQPNEDRLQLFERYEKSIWRPLTTNEEYLSYIILLCNKGYYLTRFSEIYKAVEAYEKAWMLFNKHSVTGFDIIEYCLKPLANNYSMLGDYSSAGNIIKNYLFVAEKENNTQQIISALINLAIVYHDTGKHAEAIKLLQEALTLKATPNQKGLIYSGLLYNYASLQDFVKAKHYGKLAIRQYQTHVTADNKIQLVNVNKILATISLQEGHQNEALDFIKKAQDITYSNIGIFQSRELAKLNNSYAEILKLKKDYSEALKSYQQSLMILLPQYKSQNLTWLPNASLLYAENALKETLDGLADTHLKMNELEQALACYELSFTAEDLLRGMYNYEEAKLQQQIENRNRTEQVLTTLYNMFLQTKDKKYSERAFQFAERTKAIMLKENIDEQYFRESIHHDTLVKQEKALLYKLAILNSDIAIEQMKQSNADINRVHALIMQQTQVTSSLREIERVIKEKYPKINLNDPFKPINIYSVQKKLEKDNAVLVEYFSGKDALFVFTVRSKNIEFKKNDDLPSLKRDILELHGLFSNASAINNGVERYKDLAFQIYTILTLPKEEATKNLILIPDGLLHLIPFDALLIEKSEGKQYNSFPYLLTRYSIAYQPAAFIYANENEKPISTDKKGLFAMFPIFENTNRELTYSQKEAEGIDHYMDGKYVYKQHATRKAFIQNADRYSFIHLSTHASTGDSPEPPSITFIDSTLYLPQIYGLRIKADLLVLSACETGVGLLVKGEGALSLARGFQFAGVHNIIFSLWSVNDYSTSTLMVNFYKNYVKTGSKVQALQLAKLNYLTDNTISNNHKSPYYWAGFIYYGNVETQPLDNNWGLIIGIVLAATFLLLLLVLLYIRKRNTRRLG